MGIQSLLHLATLIIVAVIALVSIKKVIDDECKRK